MMKQLSPYKNLLLSLASLALLHPTHIAAAVVPRTADCHSHHYAGPTNPSFETGDLTGWTVVSGTAFGNASVTATSSYWGGPFSQVGKQFLWGILHDGEPAVGELRSSTFRASSVMSFLVGGGYDPVNLYVGLVRENDGTLLFSQTGTNDEALIRIIWDTSAYAGQNVYLVVVDTSTVTSWGHINLDDVRTGCDALGDGGLSFNVLGQNNQPPQTHNALSTPSLYALDPIRPQFHYSPYQGWINDPCGLIQWGGKYHLMSQFNPAAPVWGPMHWSHVESADAVHWSELPVALYPPYPNNPLDTSGRYTGSALQDKDTGALQVIFTDATDTALHPDAKPEVVSSAVSSDGINFSLYSGNPIIAAPPPNSPSGFRDPKVFWDTTDSSWKMVIGSGDNNSGKVQLYQSTRSTASQLTSWEYVGVLYEGDGSTGTMWECPNFFPIDGKWVLFYGGNGLGWYEVGTYNGTTFTSEKRGLLDAGPDSYAMQWFIDDSGRNLAITWMGNWGTSKWPSRVNGWAGTQSIMRELFIRDDGGLGNKIVDEVSLLASGAAKSLGQTNVHGTVTVGSSNTARLQASIDLVASNAPAFTIELFALSAESVSLVYTFANQSLTLDTTQAGYGQAGTWSAIIAKPADNILSLDILIDRSSLEVFAGDGTVMTATVFPRYQESTDIQIVSHGGKTVFGDIVLTPLGSAWV
ncbi:Arabinanase/levansucrase/invertase [Coniochaeta ligniaria NRRL 30616]|uniref:beta-fructofuranosidase n=1 Tax=Coniochaeta ligniaria NRRL 30616 TaxID=1408157 RepID=A0A1J7J634_9PEZI|nr:Arabinanase/levansucrase/invertase [Coniochaeta ligniaria NRRL 30616]